MNVVNESGLDCPTAGLIDTSSNKDTSSIKVERKRSTVSSSINEKLLARRKSLSSSKIDNIPMNIRDDPIESGEAASNDDADDTNAASDDGSVALSTDAPLADTESADIFESTKIKLPVIAGASPNKLKKSAKLASPLPRVCASPLCRRRAPSEFLYCSIECESTRGNRLIALSPAASRGLRFKKEEETEKEIISSAPQVEEIAPEVRLRIQCLSS
jgi:hypothetical protein